MDYIRIIIAAIGLVCTVAAFILGSVFGKKKFENEIGSAKEQANKIVTDAMKKAAETKKESLLEAKDEIHQLRTEHALRHVRFASQFVF